MSDMSTINTELDVCFQRKVIRCQSLDFSRQLLSKYFPGAPRPILGAVHQENIWTKVDDEGAVGKELIIYPRPNFSVCLHKYKILAV